MTIDIGAPPELVFGVVGDPTRWPALLPHYRAVQVLTRNSELLARYVAIRPVLGIAGLGFPVAWTSRFASDPERLELRFRHVAGVTRGMAVTWRLEPRGAGTRVTLIHELGRAGEERACSTVAGPRPGSQRHGHLADWYARFLDRWFVRPIAGRTLTTFKAICESLPASWGAPASAAQAEVHDEREEAVHAR
jgi:ribosome-associated toxin RatA of RatAB toxin-antitoxin module